MRANVSRCKTRCVPTCTCCCRFACAAHACALVVEICHLQQGYVSCLGCDCVRSVQARMCQLAHDTSKTAPRIRACRDRATAMERAACGLTEAKNKFLGSSVFSKCHRHHGPVSWQSRGSNCLPQKSWVSARCGKAMCADCELWPGRGKAVLKARVRRVCAAARAKAVATACAKGLRRVCLDVIAKGGAATRS